MANSSTIWKAKAWRWLSDSASESRTVSTISMRSSIARRRRSSPS